MPYPPLPGMYFPTEKPWVNMVINVRDRNVASIAFGFTLGFFYFVLLRVIRETRRVGRFNTYVIMIWTELAASLVLSFLCYLLVQELVRPTFFVIFFIILQMYSSWAIETLLQIIINRICILLDNRNHRINHKYTELNVYSDRVEKCIYLILDAGLNWFFIRRVKTQLCQYGGFKKYQRLVTFNTRIIWVSIAMDLMIIGMMSYPSELVYTLMHPIQYLVKLNIEMAMSHLIIKVARETGIIHDEGSTGHAESTTIPTRGIGSMRVSVQITRTQQDELELAEQGKAVWAPEKGSPSYNELTNSIIDLSPNSKDRHLDG
ncbi:hypothetical protein BKA62DRAFT_768635 [Auriculariales sp. MPI-PUGE-AT-0066]|nr:hypothetical protein BKA62DRAFT_768635 [Auriculariales sp. MPI-PUGE-AT-0066]